MRAISFSRQTTAKLTDTEVIGRILSGEKELFEILMRRYNQTLYRVVRGYIVSESEVEDIMQEAYLKAYLKLDEFRGNSAFSTWLIRIGMNEALQKLRKRKQAMFIEAAGTTDHTHKIVAPEPGPEKKVIGGETRAILEQTIDRLPEKYRLVFILHELEGTPRQEIARLLDLSDSNVKVRLHRAKKLLKDDLLKQSMTSAVFEFGNSRCDRVVSAVMNKI
ncbi:MAG: RNA polymerase sigma factor [Bacteroidota bacterium]|nr:RNA polymerase sigma factor [Bacteroidota bacterium]